MKISREFSKLVSQMLKYTGKDPKQVALRDYIKLIIVMARKYTRARVDYQDIIMEGVNGLMEAVDKFDPERSTDFKTYAIMRMKGRMYQYCLTNKSLVHIPTHIANAMSHVERMLTALGKEPKLFGAEISSMEIVKVFEHSYEDQLPKHTLKFIRNCKRKINNLAENSMTTYEKITKQAIMALTAHPEAGESEAGLEHRQDPINISTTYDFLIFLEEKEDDLKKAMGERKFFTLKLKMQGYNYKEISTKLFRAGFTDREVSRQAVKGSLEKAKKILIDEGFTKDD